MTTSTYLAILYAYRTRWVAHSMGMLDIREYMRACDIYATARELYMGDE